MKRLGFLLCFAGGVCAGYHLYYLGLTSLIIGFTIAGWAIMGADNDKV